MKAFLTEWLITHGTGWKDEYGPDWIDWWDEHQDEKYQDAVDIHGYLDWDDEKGCRISQKGLEYLKNEHVPQEQTD